MARFPLRRNPESIKAQARPYPGLPARSRQRIESIGDFAVPFFAREIGCGFAFFVARRRVGAEHQQHRDDRKIAGGRGFVQGAHQALLREVRVGAFQQQQLQRRQVRARHRGVDRRDAQGVGRLRIDVRAGIDQQTRDLGLFEEDAETQGRKAVGMALFDVLSEREESLHRGLVAGDAGLVEVEIGVLAVQERDHLRAFVVGGEHQRRQALRVARRQHGGIAGHQRPQARHVVLFDGREEIRTGFGRARGEAREHQKNAQQDSTKMHDRVLLRREGRRRQAGSGATVDIKARGRPS